MFSNVTYIIYIQITIPYEVESKKEQERYIQFNAQFQKIARRDKQALFNEHQKGKD